MSALWAMTTVILLFLSVTNTLGGFDCICRMGFNMTTDQDCIRKYHTQYHTQYLLLLLLRYIISVLAINECLFPELNDCHPDATCTNTFDGFTCACDEGYSGNGTQCTSM